MNFGLDFGSIGIVKNSWQASMNMFMMHVGKVYWHVYSLFYGHDKILWVNLWVWKIFGHGKNNMGMNFDYRKILLGM